MYKCQVPECGRAFIQLSNLQQHLRSHVSQSERLKNRPFHCAICDRGFATESSMRTHNSKVCTDTDTETWSWFRLPIPKPGFGCTRLTKTKKGWWSSLSNWDLWFRQCCCKFDNWIKALPQSGTRHFVRALRLFIIQKTLGLNMTSIWHLKYISIYFLVSSI